MKTPTIYNRLKKEYRDQLDAYALKYTHTYGETKERLQTVHFFSEVMYDDFSNLNVMDSPMVPCMHLMCEDI